MMTEETPVILLKDVFAESMVIKYGPFLMIKQPWQKFEDAYLSADLVPLVVHSAPKRMMALLMARQGQDLTTTMFIECGDPESRIPWRVDSMKREENKKALRHLDNLTMTLMSNNVSKLRQSIEKAFEGRPDDISRLQSHFITIAQATGQRAKSRFAIGHRGYRLVTPAFNA